MSCEKEKDVTVIKLGHGLSISHPVHKAMEFMAVRLKEKSDPTVLLEIYPNQQLQWIMATQGKITKKESRFLTTTKLFLKQIIPRKIKL